MLFFYFSEKSVLYYTIAISINGFEQLLIKTLSNLSDYINNEVNKLCSDEEIRLRSAEIRMRK